MILENTESVVESFTNEDMAESRTEKKIYKNDDNTDILKEKLFKLGNVLRAVIATLFIMGN